MAEEAECPQAISSSFTEYTSPLSPLPPANHTILSLWASTDCLQDSPDPPFPIYLQGMALFPCRPDVPRLTAKQNFDYCLSAQCHWMAGLTDQESNWQYRQWGRTGPNEKAPARFSAHHLWLVFFQLIEEVLFFFDWVLFQPGRRRSKRQKWQWEYNPFLDLHKYLEYIYTCTSFIHVYFLSVIF